MILTLSQIKDITLGALDVVSDDGGNVVFKRFTDKQTEFYKNGFENFHLRSMDAAGIRLSATTDASRIKMSFSMKRGATASWLQIDVVCDGALIKHFDFSSYGEACDETLECPLPEGEHLVTVHLPSLAVFTLKNLELSDATALRPHTPKGPRILFLGDSITHGASTVYPSLTYTARLTAMTDADALNQGIGGEIFRAEILDSDLPFDPEIITVAFGTNDWSCARNDPELRAKRANAFFEKLRESFPKAKLVYVSPIWRALSPEENVTFLPSCELFKSLALSHGFTLIDGFTLVPHLSEFYQDKNLHPNALGFSLYAENLAVALKKHGII